MCFRVYPFYKQFHVAGKKDQNVNNEGNGKEHKCPESIIFIVKASGNVAKGKHC